MGERDAREAKAGIPYRKKGVSQRHAVGLRLGDGTRLLRAGEPIFDPVDREVATGVVVVGRVVTDALTAEVVAIEGLYDSFMTGLAEKDPILSNYQLTFLLMTLLIVFSALWVGMYLARGVTVPIQKLAEGTRAVAAGDLSYQVEVDAQDELGTLVESFNQMTSDLRAGQENLRQSRDSLQATNTELDERRRYMEAMLANIGTGVPPVGEPPPVALSRPAREAENAFLRAFSGRSCFHHRPGRGDRTCDAGASQTLRLD